MQHPYHTSIATHQYSLWARPITLWFLLSIPLLLRHYPAQALEKQPTPSTQPPPELPESCTPQDVVLEHAIYLSQHEQRQLVAPYLGRQLSSEDIKELSDNIRARYLAKGYPTFNIHTTLAQQYGHTLLKLRVVPGIVENIHMATNNWQTRLQLMSAFPGIEGKPLSLYTLGKSLEQFNKVPSNNAQVNILPGNTPGSSIVKVNNTVINPYRLEVGSNMQSGSPIRRIDIAVDNPLSINDTLRLQHSHNTDFSSRSAQYTCILGNAQLIARTELRSSESLIPTAPIRSSQSPISTAPIMKHSRSEWEHTLAANYLIFVRNHHKAHLQLSYTLKDNQGKLNARQIGNQFHKKYIVNGLLQYTLPLGGGHLSASIATNVGWLYKQVYTSRGIPLPPIRFQTVTPNLLWIRPFIIYTQPINYQVRLAAHHGWDTEDLYLTQEQMALTGASAVRGIQQPISTPSGMTMTHELSLSSMACIHPWLASLSPFVGIDWSHSCYTQVQKRRNWLGTILGLRYQNYGLSVEAAHARPLLDKDAATSGVYPTTLSITLHIHKLSHLLSQKK